MLKGGRWVVVVAIWSVATLAIYRNSFVPLRCNAIEQQVETVTIALATSEADSIRIGVRARDNLSRLGPCLEDCPSANRFMIAAANERLLGRNRAALNLYQKAMSIDRRPELFLNLGLMQVALGETKVGMDNLVTACNHNPNFLDTVSVYHDEVQHQVSLYQLHMVDLERKMKR